MIISANLNGNSVFKLKLNKMFCGLTPFQYFYTFKKSDFRRMHLVNGSLTAKPLHLLL